MFWRYSFVWDFCVWGGHDLGIGEYNMVKSFPNSERLVRERKLKYVPVSHDFLIFEHLEHVIKIAFLRGTKI